MSESLQPSAVRVYPGYNALYYSYYLLGLSRLGQRVLPRRAGFPELGQHGLALETVESIPRRIFISASDGPGLNSVAMNWCDVYAKVNLDVADLEKQPRCLAIGPSFPIRFLGPARAFFQSLGHYGRCRGRVEVPREHFANYYRQIRDRFPLDAYQPEPSDSNYVFFASTLWTKEQETNRYRANFVKACRLVPGLTLEGGFVPRRSGRVPGFEEVSTSRRYPPWEYLSKIKRSSVVFNTPAVSSCHGWKLGEFLALGKAIISTPLSRALPAELENGVHLHYVDGSIDSIREAVDHLARDPEYRRHLEIQARAYYLRYLSPERVIERALAAAHGDTQ